MNKKLVLILSLIFLSLSAWANTNCHVQLQSLLSLPRNPYVRNYLLKNEEKLSRRVVRQCRGSCYFESSLTHFEQTLSNETGEEIQLERVSLIQELLKRRVTSRFIQPFFSRPNEGVAWKGDIFSGGNAFEIANFLGKRAFNVISNKSQSFTYKENKLISKIIESLENELAKYWKLNKTILKSLYAETKYQRISDLENLLNYLLAMSGENKRVLNERGGIVKIEQFLSDLKLVDERHYYQKDLELTLRYVLRYFDTFKILYKDYDEILNLVPLANLKQSILELASFEQNMKKVSEEIVDDVFNNYKPEIENLNYQISGKLNVGKVQLYSYDEINESILPLMMSHHYPIKMRSARPGEAGVLMRKPVTEVKGSSHQVNIVDIIRDELGDIEFYVIQNSWGLGNGHRGHEFMHKSLFDDLIRFRKYQVEEVQFLPNRPVLDWDMDL